MAQKASSKKSATKGLSKDTKVALEVGAGVMAAAAAAGAGYYFYGDKASKKHRAAATKWAKGMKEDVLKQAKKLQKIDQKSVAAIVDKATAAYSSARTVDKTDLNAASKELKKHWKSVQEEIDNLRNNMNGVSKSAKRTGRAAKTATKKSAKTVKKVPTKAAPKTAKKSAKRA